MANNLLMQLICVHRNKGMDFTKGTSTAENPGIEKQPPGKILTQIFLSWRIVHHYFLLLNKYAIFVLLGNIFVTFSGKILVRKIKKGIFCHYELEYFLCNML